MKILSKDEMKRIMGGVEDGGGVSLCNNFCGETAGGTSCASDPKCKYCTSMGGQKGPQGQTHTCSMNPEVQVPD